MIYEDANTLERVLMDKVKELGPLPDNPKSKSTASTPTRNVGYVIACIRDGNIAHFAFSSFSSFFFSLSHSTLGDRKK